MEPLTTTALGITLWEYLGKPIIDKIKDKYSEKMLNTILSTFKIENDDRKIIVLELLKCDKNILSNRDMFLNYINKNKNIQNLLKEKPIIIRSLVDIDNSEINIASKSPYMNDSFNNIKNSKIKIG
ncbi:MAG: hypothetical protein MJK08_00845 [Campylobacterales bacterium]|nr:hypothetical protein [Campylobacterales bacterium]